MQCRHARPIPRGDDTNSDEEYRDADWLGHWLAATELAPTPSEAQGMFCGFVCGGAPDPESAWLAQLLPPEPDDDERAARTALTALAARLRAALADPDYGFVLPLPADDQPLLTRATALHDWLRGFLYALGLLGARASARSAQGRAILRDFIELTRLDLDTLDENETNEEALTEVSEYLRMATLLFLAERNDTVPNGSAPA